MQYATMNAGEPIRVRAPGRVNLIGDHTDYTGGLAFPMTIDRWTTIEGSPSERIILSSADEPSPVDIAPSDPPDAPGLPAWGRYVAAIAAELGTESGIEGTVTTTIPVGAGLSSSAALEVALALALGFSGTAADLAALARRAEHRATGVPTGIMDQLCIASARAGHATMIDFGSGGITHVPVPDEVAIVIRFIEHRTLEGSGYADRVTECARAEAEIGPLREARRGDAARLADPVLRRRARHVVTENERVAAFADALHDGDYASAGRLMTESHVSLRDDYATSTPRMDAAVEALNAHPMVFGARMTGGGFGGCVVALCQPDSDVDGCTVRPVDGARRL